ncbi:MAG: hypothetical protein M3020_12240 [Myxococcota bacterium]|nr:hypothetical protein [Myxococcota bacterium]
MSHLACLEPSPDPDFESAGDDPLECLSECVGSLRVVTMANSALVALGCAAVPPACPIFSAASVAVVIGSCSLACDELSDPPITTEP